MESFDGTGKIKTVDNNSKLKEIVISYSYFFLIVTIDKLKNDVKIG